MNTKVVMSTTTSARTRNGSSAASSCGSGASTPAFRSVADTAQCARRRPAGALPSGAHERGAAGPTSLDAPESVAGGRYRHREFTGPRSTVNCDRAC